MLRRRLRTLLPTRRENLEPRWPDFEEVRRRDEADQTKKAFDYNRRHGVRPLTDVPAETRVYVKDAGDRKTGVVQDHSTTPRSYGRNAARRFAT